jgi:hypothetical protein
MTMQMKPLETSLLSIHADAENAALSQKKCTCHSHTPPESSISDWRGTDDGRANQTPKAAHEGGARLGLGGPR